MTRRPPRHQALRTLCLAALMIAGGASCSRDPGTTIAPGTTFSLLDDTRITLSNRQGKPTLVVFFALNNPLALDELERMEQVSTEFAADDLELIAVAQSSDRPDLVRSVMHDKQFLFPVAMDPDGSTAAAFGGLSTTPAVYLLSPQGEVSFASEGPADINTLRKHLAAY